MYFICTLCDNVCMYVCSTLESRASSQVLHFSAIVSDSSLLLFSTASVDNFQALALRCVCVCVSQFVLI